MLSFLSASSFLLAVSVFPQPAKAKSIAPKVTQMPVTIQVEFSDCRYLEIMKRLYPDVFVDERTVEMKDDNLLACWSKYLAMEREMVSI